MSISRFLLILVFLSASRTLNFAQVVQRFEFSFTELENCETGKSECPSRFIIRTHIEDSIVIVFPSGGSFSDMMLFPDSIANSRPLNFQTDVIRQDAKRAGEGKLMISLKGLPDGKYVAKMMSCGLGGEASIELKTNLVLDGDSIHGQKIVPVPETEAEYPGGMAEMLKYMNQRIHYVPRNDTEVKSKIVVQFVVDEKGEIHSVKFLKNQQDWSDETQNEILQALLSMPTWKPATLNGKAVPVRMNLPIIVHWR